MVKGEAVMAVAIKPLRRIRRTAQRGKPMKQSQRWGKVVTTMPIPEGEITTAEILEADAQPATEEYIPDEIVVPEVVPVEEEEE